MNNQQNPDKDVRRGKAEEEENYPLPDADKMEEVPAAEPSQMTSTIDMIRSGVKYKPQRPIRKQKSLFEWLGIKKRPTRAAIVMTLLFLCAMALTFLFYGLMMHKNRQLEAAKADAELREAASAAEREQTANRLAALQEEYDTCSRERESLQKQLQELQEKLNGDGIYKELEQQIGELQGALDGKTTELAELQKQIDALKNAQTVHDLSNVTRLLDELDGLLISGAPLRTEAVQSTDEYGTIIYVNQKVYPHVSMYYLDLAGGMAYASGSDTVYNANGAGNMALALSILEKASEEQAAIAAAERAGTEYQDEIRYDFSRIYTYTDADSVAGGSVIKNAGAGKEYTHLELIRILLQYNDPVAAAQLAAFYGTSDRDGLLISLGCTVMKDNPESCTVHDVALILREAYRFMTGGGSYASDMREAMTSAASTSLSGLLPEQAVARQNLIGTGAYHEFGIVMGEHPYLAVVLSDMGYAGDEVTGYLTALSKKITELHSAVAG